MLQKKKMILVVDGKGGGMGKAMIEALIPTTQAHIIAAGTNAVATANMLRGGAHDGATGENAICTLAAKADVIVGSLAIITANAMLGEITAPMAQAIGASDAQKILLPLQRCGLIVVGIGEPPLKRLLAELPKAVNDALTEVALTEY